MKQKVLFILTLVFFASFTPFHLFEKKEKPAKAEKIKPIKKIGLKFREPSEIFASSDASKFFVLADKAFLYVTDAEGKELKKAPVEAYDIEGGCMANGKLYVSDESMRQILVIDEQTLKVEKTVQLHYEGPRNLAFESITYIPNSKTFLLATEKAPCIFYQYNEQFQQVNQFGIKGIKEVSAMTFYNNTLYVLSDEQATVFKVDPVTFSVLKSWRIPMDNPEGIAFNAQGQMMVVSDDMGKLFIFNNPDN